MILPLPLIWRVRLPTNTKISLTALFSLGFLVVAATIVSAYMGSQKDFISGANFVLWCNIAITASAAVGCAPQIRTLFLKRFRKTEVPPERHVPTFISMDEQPITSPQPTLTSERRDKHKPLILSNKFLSGDGKVGIGNARLSEKRDSGELDMVQTDG